MINIRAFQLVIESRLKSIFNLQKIIDGIIRNILIVKRTSSRSLVNHDELVNFTKLKFPDAEIKVLSDDNLPSLSDIFLQFYQADLIIGPRIFSFVYIVIIYRWCWIFKYSRL